MKKILFATMLMLLSLSFVSCSDSKEKLKKAIEQVNKEMPLDLGMAGELTEIVYDQEKNNVVMTLTFSEEMPVKPSALSQLKNTLKRLVFSEWAKSEDVREMFKEISGAGASFAMVMQNAEKDDRLELNVTESELKELAKGNADAVSPREFLEMQVTLANVQCPMQIDETTILSSVSLEGNNFVYNYSVDENVVDVDLLESNIEIVKKEVKQSLSQSDPVMDRLKKYVKEAGTNFMYRYIGDQTGNTCSFIIKSSELD